MSRQGRKACIVTNDHVARPQHLPADIKVVLGSGTASERSYPSTIIGDDPVRDLAILEIDGAALPANLSLSTAKPHETQGVYVLGFPFGEDLASNQRQFPAITVGARHGLEPAHG